MRKIDEPFDERLTDKLQELMELTKDDGEPDFYAWYQGCNDFNKMKKSFIFHYCQVVQKSQKEYLDFLLDLIKKQKREKAEVDRLIPIYEGLIIEKCNKLGIEIGSLDFQHPKLREVFTRMVETPIEKRAMLCTYNVMVRREKAKYHVKDNVIGPIYDDDDPTYYVNGIEMKESEYVKYQKKHLKKRLHIKTSCDMIIKSKVCNTCISSFFIFHGTKYMLKRMVLVFHPFLFLLIFYMDKNIAIYIAVWYKFNR